jgi:hypothetical protein
LKFKSEPTFEIRLALTFHKEDFEELKENLNKLKVCLSSPHTLEYIL